MSVESPAAAAAAPPADVSDEEDERFEDAPEAEAEDDAPQVDESGLLVDEEVTSDRTIEDVKLGEDLFLNNNFLEAQALFQAKASKSLYHSLGYSTILSVRAVMTMESEDIQSAYTELKNTVALANIYRRRQSILGSLASLVKGSGSNLRSMTKNQLHAELIYAESVFLKACISVLNDEGFMSLIKSGVNIRTSWFTFRNCHALWKEEGAKGDKTDAFSAMATAPHFTSGVSLGAGGFNLLLSLMPAKLLKIIEFVGFSASRDVGLQLLYDGCDSSGLRSPLCKLVALLYHLVLGSFLELDHVDIDAADRILQSLIKQYPTGALILYFQGKMFETKKNPADAVVAFEKAIASKLQWQQLHHICYWELAWCHCFLLQWEQAASYANRLLKENKWSKAVYAYLQAALLLMKGDSETVNELMQKVPTYKQKLGGKSLAVEKFVIRKARKYQMQGRKLLLPAFELMYAWGFSRLLGPSSATALDMVKKEADRLREESKTCPFLEVKGSRKSSKDATTHLADDFCLALLLQGTIQREMKDLAGAEASFNELLSAEAALTLDHYIAPYARMEHAKVLMERQQWSAAKEQLALAISKYDHYSNQGRLRMRVHVLTQQVEEALGAK